MFATSLLWRVTPTTNLKMGIWSKCRQHALQCQPPLSSLVCVESLPVSVSLSRLSVWWTWLVCEGLPIALECLLHLWSLVGVRAVWQAANKVNVPAGYCVFCFVFKCGFTPCGALRQNPCVYRSSSSSRPLSFCCCHMLCQQKPSQFIFDRTQTMAGCSTLGWTGIGTLSVLGLLQP